eukprot:1176420-Prorocentrum_minimum.AAC.1
MFAPWLRADPQSEAGRTNQTHEMRVYSVSDWSVYSHGTARLRIHEEGRDAFKAQRHRRLVEA